MIMTHVQQFLWVFCNVTTALAFFWIAYEMIGWRRALPLRSFRVMVALFISFVVLSGITRLIIAAVSVPVPNWALIIMFGPLAVVSVYCAVVIARQQSQIIEVLKALYASYRKY